MTLEPRKPAVAHQPSLTRPFSLQRIPSARLPPPPEAAPSLPHGPRRNPLASAPVRPGKRQPRRRPTPQHAPPVNRAPENDFSKRSLKMLFSASALKMYLCFSCSNAVRVCSAFFIAFALLVPLLLFLWKFSSLFPFSFSFFVPRLFLEID